MRWKFVTAALLVCSILANLYFWNVRQSLLAEREALRADIAALQMVRAADARAHEIAAARRMEAQQEAHKKQEVLDALAKDANQLDDAEYLDRLRGMFPDCADNGSDPAGKPSAGLPTPGDAGSNNAKP